MAKDKELVLKKKRVFFFGSEARFHAFVHQGGHGRWRWIVRDISTDTVESVSPVYGWDTSDDAGSACRQYHEAMGVEVQEVND